MNEKFIKVVSILLVVALLASVISVVVSYVL